jgi:riboflavin kinase/FMN adenylyltransferase
MQRHGTGEDIGADARGAAIALGSFDGVHLGHQAVIASARAAAAALGAPLGAAVFEPHPRRFFQPDAPPFRLQTSHQRARAMDALGVAHLYEIRFDRELSQLSAADFAEQVLARRLAVRHVSVGADFRFGRARGGDAQMLAELGSRLGFSVEALPLVGGDAKVASSAIREAISAGAMEEAARALTRPWAIEGVVQRGFARGRDFGFATANIALGEYLRPRLGIYAVRVRIDDARRDGVASVGVNPTVGALPEPLLETHIFDFDGDLYGKMIEVEMIAFVREEKHFDDVELMKREMAEDSAKARAALARAR